MYAILKSLYKNWPNPCLIETSQEKKRLPTWNLKHLQKINACFKRMNPNLCTGNSCLIKHQF